MASEVQGKQPGVDRQLKDIARWLKVSFRSVVRQSRAVRELPQRRRSPRHLLYLAHQLDKSTRYSSRRSDRTDKLVGKAVAAAKVAGIEPSQSTVLCIGCRTPLELDLFEAAGFSTVGVDLFSSDERIRRMDMHDLQLDADSFEMLYACHSLEHTLDASAVVSEMIRVARPGAVCTIEVPVRFRTSLTDLQDYESIEGIIKLFGAAAGRVFFQEESEGHDGTVARLALEIRKDQ